MKTRFTRLCLLALMLLAAWTGKAENVIATWDFQHMEADAVSLQKNSGEVPSSILGLQLTIDATGGKFKTRGTDAQMNAGTIVRVPVKSTKDTVTVTSYPGYHNYTVGGTPATADITAHKATSAEAAQGYVEITGTGSSYLYAICVVQVSSIQEKQLYTTTFANWTDAASTKTESVVTQATKYSHETLSFSLLGTQVSSTNKNTAKFPNWTAGYLMCDKSSAPYILTSALASITRVHFIHGATGSKRGWKLEAKGDGDADWVTLSDAVATTAQGTEVEVDVNRTNCQLRFTNLNGSQNAYLFQLDIYGNVDMSSTPALGHFGYVGTTYQAADIFSEQPDGTHTATIELSKKLDMVSTDHPLQSVTAANGEIGAVTYTTTGEGTTVSIPVTANGSTVTYLAHFVYKPDFTLTYYDIDGTTVVGTQQVEKDASISSFAYTGDHLLFPECNRFRGWVAAPAGSSRKFTTADIITANTSLYARATSIEWSSTSRRDHFALTDPYFYPEDHEAFTLQGQGKFHDSTHGWQFANGDSLHLLVGGNAYILAQLCRYGDNATIKIVNSKGDSLSTITTPVETDGASCSYYYQGDADTLTLVFSGAPYIHALTVINVEAAPISRNEAGYYVVRAGDADNLLSTIEIANATAKGERVCIFLPRGTYHLGETVLTPISGSNISIIGEDRDETIVVNAPQVKNEGIGTTATFLITGENTYLQDLTLRNDLDYYASGAAGRAVVIQDKGNRTICKNVKMLSYQDTYYSNSNGQFYFEDSEIHGTVDYVCGSGDVFFNRVTFVNESRSANGKTGEDVIAAPNPGDAVAYGYVMDHCTIVNKAAHFSLGRSWGGKSKLTYLNTTIMQPSELAASRFTAAGMNTPAYSFKEYASVDSKGSLLTPADNTLTFSKDKQSYTYNTTLTADEAQGYALDKVFTNWQPATLARQAVMGKVLLSDGQLSWEPVPGCTAYAVFADGKLLTITTGTSLAADANVKQYTVRAANSMGGFGKAAQVSVTNGIHDLTHTGNMPTAYYTLDGTRLSQPQRGVNICVSKQADGSVKVEKKVMR